LFSFNYVFEIDIKSYEKCYSFYQAELIEYLEKLKKGSTMVEHG